MSKSHSSPSHLQVGGGRGFGGVGEALVVVGVGLVVVVAAMVTVVSMEVVASMKVVGW